MVPLAVALAVILTALSATAAFIALAVILVICAVGLAAMRVQYLKENPPDPELIRKPFWKF
jgi:hypothetical protein